MKVLRQHRAKAAKVLMKPKPAAARIHSNTRLPAGPSGLIRFAAKIDIVPAMEQETSYGQISEATRLLIFLIHKLPVLRIEIHELFSRNNNTKQKSISIHLGACKHED